MYKVSVIIPVYNAQEYLHRCLNSVVNQTLKDIEIICVNDCSTDNSLEILNDYAQKDNRIKIINHSKNGGESKARNTGLKNVTGEYIGFVDNDDEIDLDFYERLYNKAIETGADITKAQHYQYEYNGEKRFLEIYNNQEAIEKNKLFFIGMWWTAIYKTSLIKNNNIWLPEGYLISGDRIFLQETLLKANFVSTIKGTYYYHFARENSGAGKILSGEKILSAVKAIKYQTNQLNEYNIAKTNPEGYDYIFKEQFKILIVLHNSNIDNSNIKMYTQEMIDIYKTCERKESFTNFIKNDYLCLLKYIETGDLQGLVEFLEINNSSVKFHAANLRAKISKRS